MGQNEEIRNYYKDCLCSREEGRKFLEIRAIGVRSKCSRLGNVRTACRTRSRSMIWMHKILIRFSGHPGVLETRQCEDCMSYEKQKYDMDAQDID